MTLSLTGGQLSISDTLVIKFVRLMKKEAQFYGTRQALCLSVSR